MAADLQDLGLRIKKRRQALGMRSQQELADRLGVNRTTVSSWESGKNYPARHVGALEEVLGIQFAEQPAGPTDEEVEAAMRILNAAAGRAGAQYGIPWPPQAEEPRRQAEG